MPCTDPMRCKMLNCMPIVRVEIFCQWFIFLDNLLIFIQELGHLWNFIHGNIRFMPNIVYLYRVYVRLYVDFWLSSDIHGSVQWNGTNANKPNANNISWTLYCLRKKVFDTAIWSTSVSVINVVAIPHNISLASSLHHLHNVTMTATTTATTENPHHHHQQVDGSIFFLLLWFEIYCASFSYITFIVQSEETVFSFLQQRFAPNGNEKTEK